MVIIADGNISQIEAKGTGKIIVVDQKGIDLIF
jgi:hypothetical protein